ncbi:hypothetical protein IQ255_28780 [Pleurocapsales cyanobacterium LEGE 10410]|nr:hypothetical protein [Pleurocapsales cyanobacterium LEGE 10410]
MWDLKVFSWAKEIAKIQHIVTKDLLKRKLRKLAIASGSMPKPLKAIASNN